jgi:hypothetical protein
MRAARAAQARSWAMSCARRRKLAQSRRARRGPGARRRTGPGAEKAPAVQARGAAGRRSRRLQIRDGLALPSLRCPITGLLTRACLQRRRSPRCARYAGRGQWPPSQTSALTERRFSRAISKRPRRPFLAGRPPSWTASLERVCQPIWREPPCRCRFSRSRSDAEHCSATCQPRTSPYLRGILVYGLQRSPNRRRYGSWLRVAVRVQIVRF